VAAISPPVDHLIGPVRVRECRADSTDARSAALARLSNKAATKGATGVLNVRVEVDENNLRYLKNGIPNPCLFETVAKGDAVLLGGSQQAALQLKAK
jgi:uncharacterized protein YbjQ (UPF0145 family)